MTGLGLLEAVPRETILDLADKSSGKARFLDSGQLGRFSWKSGSTSLADQVARAAFEGIGLTSSAFGQIAGQPELSDKARADLVFYSRTLAVPLAEGLAEQTGGAALCAGCHRPTVTTGNHPLAALSHQEVHP